LYIIALCALLLGIKCANVFVLKSQGTMVTNTVEKQTISEQRSCRDW